MGIRLHKILGYGFDDVRSEGSRIVDDRFNPDGFARIWDDEDRGSRWNLEGYIEFLTRKRLALKGSECGVSMHAISMECYDLENGSEKFWLEDAICFRPEFGLPNVFCVTPLSESKSWQRYNDPIDIAIEEYRLEQNPTFEINHCEFLKNGFYPWCYSFRDRRDGRQLNKGCEFRRASSLPRERACGLLEELSREMGFESLEECEANFAPCVPDTVASICEYCEIFSDPNLVWSLKPMIYSYWS